MTLHRLKSSDGMILASALLILLALTGLGIAVASTTTSDIRFSTNHRDMKQAFYAAEAGMLLALQQAVMTDINDMLPGPDGLPNTSDDGLLDFACCGGTSVALGNGASFNVRVTDDRDEPVSPFDPLDDLNGQAFLRAEGIAPLGSRWEMSTLIRRNCAEGSDAYMRAAVTSNGPINSLGNLIIDGRDHELDMDVVPDSGTLGISTASTFDRGGASVIGGTDRTVDPPVDIAPTKTGIENIVEENATWGDPASADYDMPLTPEQVLSLPEGKLKDIAQGGPVGSLNHQYVTDPTNLTLPLSGVTYVEMPDCGEWNPAEVVGEGVLIVHNPETCSVVKNFHALSYFNGILITDDLVHLNGNGALLGAIYVLTQTPSEGNCIGNGTLDVLYSREAIGNALDQVATCTVDVLSWSYD